MDTMTKFSINQRVKKTIFGLWCVFLSGNIVFAKDLVSIDDYTKTITENIDLTRKGYEQKDKQVYHIMQELCSVLLSEKGIFVANNKTNSIYNPKESVFVTIVCNSLQGTSQNNSANNPERPINALLTGKRQNRRNMGLICSTKQGGIADDIGDTTCENRSVSNNFDYPFLFYKTIGHVQNDRTNFSIARTYGNIDNTITAPELANKYINDHYQTVGVIPEAKNYPKTYKELTQYIKNAKKTQQEAYFININNINPTNINPTILPNISLFFINSQPSSIDIATQQPSYHKINSDIIYNELFFYTLFNSIYDNYLTRFREKTTGDIPLSRKNKKVTAQEALILQRSRIHTQKTEIIQTTTETMRQLGNLESTYPIHIGFLMYQEDLLTIRDNFSKIYLPLHQLHYKLENVQSKD